MRTEQASNITFFLTGNDKSGKNKRNRRKGKGKRKRQCQQVSLTFQSGISGHLGPVRLQERVRVAGLDTDIRVYPGPRGALARTLGCE